MTAFYIGQHEIADEVAFGDYLKQTMLFIEKHGGYPRPLALSATAAFFNSAAAGLVNCEDYQGWYQL